MPNNNAILPSKSLEELYPWLIRQAESCKIPREIAEELANDTLLAADNSFNPRRGKLKSFCKKVLRNKILNHIRDNPPNTRPFDDDFIIYFDNPETLLLDKEKTIEAKRFISALITTLSKEEALFFMKYQETLEEQNRAVTATAKRLGISSNEGTAIMKRIGRKARNLVKTGDDFKELSLKCSDSRISIDAFNKTNSSMQDRMEIPSEQEDVLSHYLADIEIRLSKMSFNNFWTNLTEEQKKRLASFN